MVNYNFNRAVIVNTYDDNVLFEGNQLIYVPLHTTRAFFEVRYKAVMMGMSAAYTGSRETVETTDVHLRLPAYTVFDFFAGFHKEVKKVNLMLNFSVENLFDKNYEVIRSYPLPGRTYHFTFSIGLNKISSEN
jgi:outer membrane cobalamin receptor